MDNIFILEHLVQRENKEKAKEVYVAFVDFKAAFDSVDRSKLWELLEDKDISKIWIRKIKKMYDETEIVVRTQEGLSDSFRTCRGVRQGCVLSPILFNLYIADLDRHLEERGAGLKLGKERIWSLAYADDLVVMAKNRDALLDMLNTLRKFLKRRGGLELNVEKTKIIVFNRKGRGKKEKWFWEGKVLEEIQAFEVFGFCFQQ